MAKKNKKHDFERTESLWRVLVLIVSGIMLKFWEVLNGVLAVVNWVITLITGKRNKDIADFCEIYNSQLYTFWRYISGVSNVRPFPFGPLAKNISKFER